MQGSKWKTERLACFFINCQKRGFNFYITLFCRTGFLICVRPFSTIPSSCGIASSKIDEVEVRKSLFMRVSERIIKISVSFLLNRRNHDNRVYFLPLCRMHFFPNKLPISADLLINQSIRSVLLLRQPVGIVSQRRFPALHFSDSVSRFVIASEGRVADREAGLTKICVTRIFEGVWGCQTVTFSQSGCHPQQATAEGGFAQKGPFVHCLLDLYRHRYNRGNQGNKVSWKPTEIVHTCPVHSVTITYGILFSFAYCSAKLPAVTLRTTSSHL